ncbi:hypothetical protein [Sporosarcina sp. NPDC096371]|uniref:hypothetical protein n=1 Tax=Sporosarcina sp. NPDC096371 TaxID=3364530 RepID=UPI0038022218
MFYLEYENDTKLVVKIHEVEPESVAEGHSVARSDGFDIGMELEFVITVDTVNEDGIVTATSTTKQVAPAYQLLKKLDDSEKEGRSLRNQLAAQEQAIFELAKILAGTVNE